MINNQTSIWKLWTECSFSNSGPVIWRSLPRYLKAHSHYTVEIWKRFKCFSSTQSQWNLKAKPNKQICVWGITNRAGKITWLSWSHRFRKKLYLNQNVFSHENEMPLFLHSSGLNSVIEKPRFCDGLVCTVGLGVKIKLRFQISPE